MIRPKTKRWILVFLCVLLIGGYSVHKLSAGKSLLGADSPSEGDRTSAVPVSVTNVTLKWFEDSLIVQGNLKSKNYALVSPRIPGVLDKIMVDEGTPVVADKTVLFQTDSLKLEKALDIARQDLVVARYASEEKEAYLATIEADLRKAEADYHRYESLYAQKVFTASAFEGSQAAFEKLSAMKRHAQSLLSLAREQEKKAKTAAAIAAKDLQDSRVTAPLTGEVSRRMAEPGEMGTPGVPVIRIDDVTRLEVSAFLPRQYYAKVQPDATRARIQGQDQEIDEMPVFYKSPTVDSTLRTFEIKCDLAGNAQWAVPGASVKMNVIFSRQKALAVPAECVVTRAGKKVIFLLDGEKARMKVVEPGLETDGLIQVTAEGLSENSRVVCRGQFLLNDGSTVRLEKENS